MDLPFPANANTDLEENKISKSQATEPFKVCSDEITHQVLSNLILPGRELQTAGLGPIIGLALGIGYYTLCTTIDRQAYPNRPYPNKRFNDDYYDTAVSFSDFICFPVLFINKPLSYIVYGDFNSRTPYYPYPQ